MKKIVSGGLLLLALSSASVRAEIKYWDSNGATAGTGATPTGNWGTSAFWSTDSAGTSATEAWTAGDSGVFSAGTNAINTFTVSGSATASAFTVEEGTVDLTGTIALGAGSINIKSNATLRINSSVRVNASVGSVITLEGGKIDDYNAGNAGSFVDVDQTIVLNGGGILSVPLNTASPTFLTILQTTTTMSGTGPLTKEGGGILAFANTNTYTGATIIKDGTLRIRTSNNRLPTGTDLTITSPGILDVDGLIQQVGSLTGSGDVELNLTAGGTLIVGGTTSPAPYTGVIRDGTAFGRLVKQGTGTLTLGGVNTYDGIFTNAAGTTIVNPGATLAGPLVDVVVNGGSLVLSNAAQTIQNLGGSGGVINLGSGHTLTVNATSATAGSNFSGAITGAGGIVKSGTVTESFLGANTYTGPTVINAGKVNTTTASTGGGSYAVADGTGLGVKVANAGTSLNISDFTLGGSAMEFDFNALGYPSTWIISNANMTANGTVTVDLKGFATPGSTTLIDYSSRSGAGSFVLGTIPPRLVGTLTDDTTNKTVTFSTTGGDSLLWVGDVAGVWDVGNAGNTVWKLTGAGTPTFYQETVQGDVVHFDDSVTGVTSVAIPTIVSPYQVTITNSATNYVFNGPGKISGTAGGLIKSGTGSVAIFATNDYFGGTIWNGGTLVAGNNSPLGTGRLTFNGGAIMSDSATARTLSVPVTLNADLPLGDVSTGDLTFQTGAWTITGSRQISVNNTNATINSVIGQDVTGRGLTKVGSGTLSLGGANTFNGGFNHTIGTVRVNANAALGAANSPVSLANGVTLATTGGTARTLTYAFMALGDLTLGQATSGTAALTLAGSLNLSGGIRTISVANASDIISAVITNGGLIKASANTLDLTGANTFTNGVQHNEGTLRVNNNAALGAANSAVALANGVTLSTTTTTARTATYAFTVNGDITLGQAAGGTAALTLAGSMNLAGSTRTITIPNATDTISAVITNGGLTKVGPGILVLSGANTYTGGTTVTEGTLQGTTAGLQGNILNNSLVTFSQTTVGTYGGVISGSGAVTKSGSGAVTLSGTNDYTGTTTNNAGTLLINGSLASPGVQVNATATIGGTGTIAGPVTIANGSIAAGNNVVSNTVGILTLQNGLALSTSTNKWELATLKDDADGTPGVDFDQVLVAGGTFDSGSSSVILLTFTNDASAPDFAVPFWQVPHKWTVLQLTNGAASAGGTAFAIAAANTNHYAGTFTTAVEADGSISLSFTPAGPTAAFIFSQPTNRTVIQGSNTTFTVGATGTAPLSYQWFFNNSLLAGATSSTLAINGATPANETNYYVIVSNSLGSATSSVATLTVLIPPAITNQPQSQSVELGANVTFSVASTGTMPLAYQWKFNGTNLFGATTNTYGIASVTANDFGNYSVVVTNLAGSITSSNATLSMISVTPPVFTSPVLSGTDLILNWSATSGSTYRLQSKPDLNSTNWTDIPPDITATGSSISVTNPVTGAEKYYRVVLLP